jgi:hypothetical protein
VGSQSGFTNQGIGAVAVGLGAGSNVQGSSAVAVGESAGGVNQGQLSVAIGSSAGGNAQGINAVAVGRAAGQVTQGNSAVAVGYLAGGDTQGINSVAIGAFAGQTNQAANSIVINASGSNLPANNAGLYINPVRNDTANVTNAMFYNTGTREVTYGAIVTGSPTFTILTANANAVMGTAYAVNTTSAAVTVTLPASASSGQSVRFVDAGGAFATNNLIVNPNGANINNVSGNMDVTTNGASFGLLWNGTTWRVFQ